MYTHILKIIKKKHKYRNHIIDKSLHILVVSIPQISTEFHGELYGAGHGSNLTLFDCSINSILSQYFSLKY